MKTVARIFIFVSALMVAPALAADAVVIGKDVKVEEAWARRDAAGSLEVFLVVNNAGADEAVLSVQVSGATDVQVIDASARSIVPSVPIHSELYMAPDGIRILAKGVPASLTVPVAVGVGTGAPVTVEAKMLSDGQAPPDHHNYDHG